MLFMSTTLLVSFLTFALVQSITPGPNNVMLMASGANFGFRSTLPHLAGVSLGFAAMVILVGLGLAGIFAAAPWLYQILRWAGAAYLVFLACKIATAKGLGSADVSGRPVSFWQAVAFQWVNPKAWSMIVSAITTFAPPDPTVWHIGTLTLLLFAVGLPCSLTWMAFGVSLKKLLSAPAPLRAFNVAMATLLVASLYPLLADAARI
ncbi:MAG: LysE family translocator [Rhodospirillaceae bacterium]